MNKIGKFKITKVFISEKNKDGIPYVFKNGKNTGKPFVRVSIKTQETGEEYYSTNAFVDSKQTKLTEGQEVILKLEEKDGFKNFGFPSSDELQEILSKAL